MANLTLLSFIVDERMLLNVVAGGACSYKCDVCEKQKGIALLYLSNSFSVFLV